MKTENETPRSIRRRWLLLVPAAVVAAALLGFTFWPRTPEEQPLRREYPIEVQDLVVGIDATGSISSHSTPQTATVPVEAARADFRQESVLYMVLIVAGGGLLVYLFTGRALRPLEQLANAMQQRTVQNLAQELPVPSGQDEVAQLTEAFKQMSRTLAQAFENQRRFAQNAAYELRTPLAVMQTRIEVFGMKSERTRQEYDSLLETVASNTHPPVADGASAADTVQRSAALRRVYPAYLYNRFCGAVTAIVPAKAAGFETGGLFTYLRHLDYPRLMWYTDKRCIFTRGGLFYG